VHELRRGTIFQWAEIAVAAVLLEVQIPVLVEQFLLDTVPGDPLPFIRLDVERSLSVEVRKMTLDGLEVLTAARENLNHDFWCTPNGPRNQLSLRRR
jgi:hypothetical protein